MYGVLEGNLFNCLRLSTADCDVTEESTCDPGSSMADAFLGKPNLPHREKTFA